MKSVSGLLKQEDKYLVLLRPEGKKYPLHWDFVGGKVEPDDTLAEAMRREALEEIGIEFPSISKILGSYRSNDLEIIVFDLGEINNLKIKLNPEHIEYRWVNTDEAINLKLMPYLYKVFEDIKENR